MKLIIWLWNPWNEYKKTRHNVGFLFLDWLIDDLNLNWEWKNEPKFKSEIFETNYNFEKTILLKPQTYMNLSWEAVLKIMSFYKIPLEDIIVIFDDISLEPWKIRFRDSWSAGWQNWVKSIISHIWENFKRIKIWIWQDKRFDLADWVLSKFNDEEIDSLKKDFFPKAKDILIDKL